MFTFVLLCFTMFWLCIPIFACVYLCFTTFCRCFAMFLYVSQIFTILIWIFTSLIWVFQCLPMRLYVPMRILWKRQKHIGENGDLWAHIGLLARNLWKRENFTRRFLLTLELIQMCGNVKNPNFSTIASPICQIWPQYARNLWKRGNFENSTWELI